MIAGLISNPLQKSPLFTEYYQTRQFAFWKPSSAVSSSNPPDRFLEYLQAIAPKSWGYSAAHIRLICEHLDAVTRGEIDRLAFFMPPRHAKTETITVRYPVHRIERDQTMRCLITGYNERFARRLGRKSRNIAETRFQIARDKDAADEWETISGGGLLARGVGSPPTGVGFHLILIDDPIRRREDAESEVFREKVWDWYTDDLYTRLEPNGAIILTLTRWHHDDLAARAIASEPGRWTVVSLPALAGNDDALNRQPGAALWPERYDVAALSRIRDVMAGQEGLYSWEALYQQNPTPREGSFFKVTQLEIVDEAPANLRLCRAWDLAASAGRGDYTAGVKLGVTSAGVWYVLDVRRGQFSTDDRNLLLRQTAQLDGRHCRIRLAQDPGQAGVDQVQLLVRMLAGFNVRAERVTGRKETRADGLSAQVNAGNVKLLRADWNKAFIEEMRTFPAGKHDDQIDAASDAFLELAPFRSKTISGF